LRVYRIIVLYLSAKPLRSSMCQSQSVPTYGNATVEQDTEKSVRDIYLDLKIRSAGKQEGHLVEDLKRRWEHFLWDFFLVGE
jgi:hypothetical protein